MEPRSVQYVVAACQGDLLSGSSQATVARACTDSRQVRPGDLFFALVGEHHDGHEFLRDVAAKGAAAVVIDRRKAVSVPGAVVIAVDDTRRALGRLAARYRSEFNPTMIAVGGSNGKTTTKELVASVLRQKKATLWSEASFNNDIGVPLTLLRLEKQHEAAVLEVGTNHPGELAPLVRLVRPQHGIITNIGREHLEFLADLEGVAQEEGWLAELLPAGGRLFVNGDDPSTPRLAARTAASVVRVGLGPGNDWQARGIRLDKQGTTFRVEAPQAGFSGEYRIRLLGRHQAVNALFALAVGVELGLSRSALERGLAECEPPKMRLRFREINGVRVLDDVYNANADSMIAALQTLMDLPCKGRRLAVLGDMAELGEQSEAAHAEVGRQAAELGVGQLFAVGKMAAATARAARQAGLTRVLEFAEVDAAAAALKNLARAGDVVLVKASRAARLERLLEAL